MAKKKKHVRRDDDGDKEAGERKAVVAPERVFSSPFKDLKKMLAARTPPTPPIKPKVAPPPPIAARSTPPVVEPLDDEALMQRALAHPARSAHDPHDRR